MSKKEMNNEGATPAGAAVEDISPDFINKRRIRMSGYMPSRSAVELEAPIEARALAIGDDYSGMLFVVIDTCLVSPLAARCWREKISRKVPLPPDRIFIVTTHTHSGPDLTFIFGGIPPEYYLKIRRGVFRAAVRAWESRAPATMLAGAGRHKLGIPRRREYGQESYDHDFTVLQWRNDGATIATLVNLACHGVVLPKSSTLLSPDLPGALCRKIDSICGGVTLFAPRDQGDVNPDIPGKNTYEQNGTVADIYRLAEEGAAAIKSAVVNADAVESARLEIEFRTYRVTIRKLLSGLINSPIWTGRFSGKPGTIDIEYGLLTIGDIRGATFPGEVLTCLGEKMLSCFDSPSLLLTCCNGWHGYFMTKETFRKGGYEPSMSPGPVTFEDMNFCS